MALLSTNSKWENQLAVKKKNALTKKIFTVCMLYLYGAHACDNTRGEKNTVGMGLGVYRYLAISV